MIKKIFFLVCIFLIAKPFVGNSSTSNTYITNNNSYYLLNDTTLKFVDAVISSDGLSITMNFNNNVYGSNTGFTIHNTTDNNFTTITGWGSPTLVGTLSNPVVYGEPVNISYKDLYTEGLISGDLKDDAGENMEFFLKELVDVSAIVFEGTEKYVTATATSGGDGSSGNPYSITKMVSNINSDYANASAKGLRYNLKAGNYGANAFQLDNVDGAFGKPIIIEGYQNVKGDSPSINWSTSYKPNGAIMPWFDAPDSGNGILIYNGSSHITLKNIEISGFDNSVYYNNVDYTWIDNVYVHESGDKAIQMVGISKENVVSNSISFRGNTFNFSTNGTGNLFINNKSYCDVNPYITDYYFSLKGKRHVFRNNLSHRIGDASHNGHALSIQTDAPNNNNVDTQETWYNFVDGLESINIVKAVEFRHGGTRYNVARDVYSHAVLDGGQHQTGGVMFRDNASFNIFENSIVDTNKSNDGFAMAFVESVEIGVGLGHDNIIRNNIFKNIQFTIVVRNYNSSRTPLMYNNKIYNNTFYNSDHLFKIPNNKNGVSLPLNISGNEVKNNIFNEIPSINTVGSQFYNISDFATPFNWDTNNFSGNTIWGAEGVNPNNFDPLFIDASNGDFQLDSASQLIDAGTNLSTVSTDFGGGKRPQGASHDIGAFEFENSFNGSAGDDVSICQGESVVLTAFGGTSYVWSSGETTESITVSPTTTTTYTVTISDETNSNTDDVVVTVEEAPTVNLGDDVLICFGESVVLTAEGNGNFLWSTGETTSSITVNPSVNTTYSVTASNSCTETATDEIIVNVNQEIILNAGDDVNICQGESVTLTAQSNGDFLWDTGETTSSITVNPSSTTTYIITSTLNGCSVTDEVIVTVDNAPSVNLGADTSICSDESITLTAEGNGNFVWNTGETTSSITVNPSTTTTYSVTATSACDAVGVSDEVIVNVTPEITLDAGNDVTICQGENITLTASGNNAFVWSTGETTASITVNPSTTTTYSVTSAVGNCSKTDEVIVTVDQTPTVSLGTDTSICSGESITLTAEGNGNFVWNTGETTSSITVNPSATTTYSVTSTSACDTNGVSDEIVITVNDVPSINAGADITIEKGSSTTLTATGEGDFLWSTGETTSSITVSPTTTTTYTVTTTSSSGCSNEDTVVVTVYDSTQQVVANAGADVEICKNSPSVVLTASGGGTYLWSTGEVTASITVNPTETTVYTVTVSNSSSIDTDEVTVFVDQECTGTGNRNPSPKEMNLYPNPTDGLLNIELSGFSNALNISFFSLNGSMIYSENISDYSPDKILKRQIDVSRFGKGVYFVRLTNNNETQTKKILVI